MIVISGFLIKQFQLFSARSRVVEFSGFSAQLTRTGGGELQAVRQNTTTARANTELQQIEFSSAPTVDHAQFNMGIPDCLFPDASLERKKEILMHKLQMQSIWLLLRVYP